MKRVLIVFPFLHHKSLVMGQCKSLNEIGIQADALLVDSNHIILYNYSKNRIPIIFRLSSLLFERLQKLRGYSRFGVDTFFRKMSYRSILNKYDIIEIAGIYEENRLSLARYAHQIKKSVFTRVWGTDFYGYLGANYDWHNDLFCVSERIIVASDKMREDFISVYPSFKDRLVVQSYGLSQLELLKDIQNGLIERDISFLDEKVNNRIVLAIGYTGRIWQQHFYVLDALETLPTELKNKLFLLLPMTYDTIPDYKLYIRKRLQRLNIPFQILDKRLTTLQVLSMRTISDISICVQFTDALAASVQEYLMAGSIFIGGEWLPYKEFFVHGCYLHETTIENLSSTLCYVLCNYETEKEKCKNNRFPIYEFSSWSFKNKELLHLYDIP